jgi:enoyl-CoA hydratase/carnithine racemase
MVLFIIAFHQYTSACRFWPPAVCCIGLCNELLEAFDRAEGDRSVGAILLTANGPEFCVGMDLREQLDADQAQLGGTHQRLFSTVQRIHKPIVAAVHGSVFEGGP